MSGQVLFGQSKRLPVQEKIPGRTALLFEGEISALLCLRVMVCINEYVAASDKVLRNIKFRNEF